MKTEIEQPSAKYLVEHFELRVGTIEVEAKSIADAITRFLDGEGSMFDGSVYVGPCVEKGVPLDEYPELEQELRDMGLQFQSTIPSIRKVSKVPGNSND